MKRIHTTNILLGIIAAEVVFLTVHAISKRPLAANRSFHPDRSEPETMPAHSYLGSALDKVARSLRQWFVGSPSDVSGSPKAGRETNREKQHISGADRNESIHPRGNMQGITEKMNDPAWSGALAANDGDIALTDAERAVPMPKSARFVQRLDRNPFIGGGMKDHGRDNT